jgi:hypothetical protein
MDKNLIQLSEYSIIRSTFVTNSDNRRSTVHGLGHVVLGVPNFRGLS